MTKRWWWIGAAALPAVLLAGIGLSHPTLLNAGTADWWTTLHLILVPVFPLLGVAVWLLLRDDRTAVGWGGRIAAIAYVVFYGALDAVSGIATGTVVRAGEPADSPVVTALFGVGNLLGHVGGYSFFVAVILVLGSAWRRGARGWMFFVAVGILLVSGYSFTTSHIYWPRGGLTMLALALGFALIEFTPRGSSATRSAKP
jgi:hypothetical protein